MIKHVEVLGVNTFNHKKHYVNEIDNYIDFKKKKNYIDFFRED